MTEGPKALRSERASAEGARIDQGEEESGVRSEDGCPVSSHREFPQRLRGSPRAGNAFLDIFGHVL